MSKYVEKLGKPCFIDFLNSKHPSNIAMNAYHLGRSNPISLSSLICRWCWAELKHNSVYTHFTQMTDSRVPIPNLFGWTDLSYTCLYYSWKLMKCYIGNSKYMHYPCLAFQLSMHMQACWCFHSGQIEEIQSSINTEFYVHHFFRKCISKLLVRQYPLTHRMILSYIQSTNLCSRLSLCGRLLAFFWLVLEPNS